MTLLTNALGFAPPTAATFVAGDEAATIPRVLIAESNDDVRALLELTVRRLGYEPVSSSETATDVDAVLLEPACAISSSVMLRFGENAPPVICFSICPREHGLEPSTSVAYLLKPASSAAIGDALRSALHARV